MLRFAFTLLAALGTIAVVTFWWQPADSPEPASPNPNTAEQVPVAAEAPNTAEQVPVAAEAPSTAEQVPVAAEAPSTAEQGAVAAEAPSTAEQGAVKLEDPIEAPPTEDVAAPAPRVRSEPVRPTLEEESVEVVSQVDFAVASAPETPVEAADEIDLRAEPRVDVDRSGELIRRMLALYQNMGE